MEKKIFSQRTVFCIISLIILLLVVIGARNVSGNIMYFSKNSDNKFHFFYENLIFGNR